MTIQGSGLNSSVETLIAVKGTLLQFMVLAKTPDLRRLSTLKQAAVPLLSREITLPTVLSTMLIL